MKIYGCKPLRVRFDKVDELIKIYDGTRCLVLFGPGKYDVIFNKSRHLISEKRYYIKY